MNRVLLIIEETRRKLIREPKWKKKLKTMQEEVNTVMNKWRLNLNTNTLFVLSLTFMFQDKEILHECETKDV